MMEVLMPLYIIALMYRTTKANAVELSECFEHVHHDGFTRLLAKTPVAALLAATGQARRMVGARGFSRPSAKAIDRALPPPTFSR